MPTITNEMTFDFDGLIQLLAGHLYSEKKVFIRELIQNAHDAIQRRAAKDPAFNRAQGHIDILTDLTASPGRIIFRDNGIGMSPQDLEEFLSTIGKSGTKVASAEVPEVIGQFGIGFLSGFVVGARVEVRTRSWQAAPDQACLWENSGNKDYTITPCALAQIGTEVTVHLRSAEDRGLLHEEAVKKVVRDYADMLRIPIHLNDPGRHGAPINTMVMPWERTGISEAEMRLDGMIYLEKTVPDSVLEAIPIRIADPAEDGRSAVDAEGLLYITRTRVLGTDAPRTVRVFLKRMFLCEQAKEILPPWASFINGIINTRSLSPNAARDNFTRDDSFIRLRDRLGDLIVAHLEHLRESEPQRLSEILAYHDLAIKAACHYYEPFFDKFVHLLEWRINAKSAASRGSGRPSGRRLLSDDTGANYTWATLPEVLAALPVADGGGPKRFSCFTTSSSANQFFEMADAAGTTVVDASYPFEAELIKAWAERRKTELSLVYVDREDDPAVFREIDPVRDRAVRVLAQQMSHFIRPGGTGRLRVEPRRFQPETLPAVLKSGYLAQGSIKARGILSDPNSPADLRTMAEEMIRLSRNADMRMSINAANTLIRTLASLVEASPDDEDLHDLMLGVYNDAILYNQELMTPRNAQVFHEQFQRLMSKSLQFLAEKASLSRERKELDTQRRQTESRSKRERKHLTAFLMTPYASDFDTARRAVRLAVEDRLGCELRTADQKTFEDFIRGNVEAHLDDADFFIADVTGANPNVMMELGAALYGRGSQPCLLVARVAKSGDKPDLPLDLAGHVTGGLYTAIQSETEIADVLEAGFRKHDRLQDLLRRGEREDYISSHTLRVWTKDILTSKPLYNRLSDAYPTASAWRKADEKHLEAQLVGEADLAAVTLRRIRENLPT
jgi:molecular chaperone HtpG